jgi:hypothetical protein
MKCVHPFQWIAGPAQKYVLPVLAVLALAVMICLYVMGMPLQTRAAPQGIISFEFAGSLENAEHMIESWGKDGPMYAGLNLGLDYLYLVLYSCALGLSCAVVAHFGLFLCRAEIRICDSGSFIQPSGRGGIRGHESVCQRHSRRLTEK